METMETLKTMMAKRRKDIEAEIKREKLELKKNCFLSDFDRKRNGGVLIELPVELSQLDILERIGSPEELYWTLKYFVELEVPKGGDLNCFGMHDNEIFGRYQKYNEKNKFWRGLKWEIKEHFYEEFELRDRIKTKKNKLSNK